MFAKAAQFVAEASPPPSSTYQRAPLPPDRKDMQESGSSDDDMPGPALPDERTVGGARNRGAKSGPAIPNIQDLELRRGKIHLHWVLWTGGG